MSSKETIPSLSKTISCLLAKSMDFMKQMGFDCLISTPNILAVNRSLIKPSSRTVSLSQQSPSSVGYPNTGLPSSALSSSRLLFSLWPDSDFYRTTANCG